MIERPGRKRETLKEGWWDFVTRPNPKPPEPLTLKEMQLLSPARLELYNRQRRAYASAMPPIRQLYAKPQELVEAAIERNEFKPPGARTGVIIDGKSANGKTTMMMDIGRKYEKQQRLIHPAKETEAGGHFTPVIYLNVDSIPTMKSLNRSFLEFYGMDPKRATTNQMTSLLLDLIETCGTTLILIDEVHMLALGRESDRDVNNHLKILANSARATFVYAGVELAKNDFLVEGFAPTEVSRAQISRRFKHVKVNAIGQSSKNEQALMSGVLKVYEDHLWLANGQEGDLVRLAPYIWKRTQGVIGSISELVYGAYIAAVRTGEERFTKELITTVQLDSEAEKLFDRWREDEHRGFEEAA